MSPEASFVLVLLISCCQMSTGSFVDWLFGEPTKGNQNENHESDDIRTTDIVARSKRFEMLSTDEKFQSFAKSLAELTPLDECYHIVVYSLKKKCGSLTEEELGKLSVQLLNCQSEAEDRLVFPCTQKMTVKECTRSMDPTTWNAYQIVSNRARAMCYATQQHQFRKLTEITVSQLVTQANNQLDNMRQLQDGQEKLHTVTAETMQKMFLSQQQLMGNQELLKSAQNDVYSHIANNLAELSREKALIATGNRELVDMTDRIRSKLDIATEQMSQQETKQKLSHETIVADLQLIQDKAQKVIDKIDNSSMEMVQHHIDMLDHYRTTLDNLVRINATINYLLSMISDTKTRISWLTQLLGGAEDKFGLLTTAVLHLIYFLLAAISAVFLQTPTLSRVMIMVVVPLNAIAEIHRGSCLDFTSMTLFIILTVFVNWVVKQIYRAICGHRHHSQPFTHHTVQSLALPSTSITPPSTPVVTMHSHEIRELTATVDRLYRSLHHRNISHFDSGNETISPVHAHPEPPTPIRAPTTPMPDSSTFLEPVASTSFAEFDQLRDVSAVRRRLTDELDKPTPRAHRRSYSRSPSRCSTPILSTPTRSHRASSRASNTSTSSRPLCEATTKSGQPCRNISLPGSDFCHKHKKGESVASAL